MRAIVRDMKNPVTVQVGLVSNHYFDPVHIVSITQHAEEPFYKRSLVRYAVFGEHRSKETQMKSAKNRTIQKVNRMPSVCMFNKLQNIIADIKTSGSANLTRLTVLKKWFERPHRLASFGIFIARQASRQTKKATKKETELFREAHKILDDVNVFHPDIARDSATKLKKCLEEFQNEYRNVPWTSVRIIHNKNLFLVEKGLHLYLSRANSPAEGYRLAADYCDNYDPRYGSGLNGPSADRIKEIADFVLDMESHEEMRL
jgi:hypothetical protein